MSIFSAVHAEHTNEMLKAKGIKLQEAIDNQDWAAVKEMANWLQSAPESE